jgi:hypothetical protein
MGDVDEKTKVPLWWVAVAIPVFIGALAWAFSVDSKATEARDKTNNIELLLTEVRDRVIKIEEHQSDMELFLHHKGEK